MHINEESCRICMGTENLESIFEIKNNVAYIEKILFCASVQINCNDGFPQKICNQCILYLDIAYIFKTVCEETDRRLHLQTNNQNDKEAFIYQEVFYNSEEEEGESLYINEKQLEDILKKNTLGQFGKNRKHEKHETSSKENLEKIILNTADIKTETLVYKENYTSENEESLDNSNSIIVENYTEECVLDESEIKTVNTDMCYYEENICNDSVCDKEIVSGSNLEERSKELNIRKNYSKQSSPNKTEIKTENLVYEEYYSSENEESVFSNSVTEGSYTEECNLNEPEIKTGNPDMRFYENTACNIEIVNHFVENTEENDTNIYENDEKTLNIRENYSKKAFVENSENTVLNEMEIKTENNIYEEFCTMEEDSTVDSNDEEIANNEKEKNRTENVDENTEENLLNKSEIHKENVGASTKVGRHIAKKISGKYPRRISPVQAKIPIKTNTYRIILNDTDLGSSVLARIEERQKLKEESSIDSSIEENLVETETLLEREDIIVENIMKTNCVILNDVNLGNNDHKKIDENSMEVTIVEKLPTEVIIEETIVEECIMQKDKVHIREEIIEENIMKHASSVIVNDVNLGNNNDKKIDETSMEVTLVEKATLPTGEEIIEETILEENLMQKDKVHTREEIIEETITKKTSSVILNDVNLGSNDLKKIDENSMEGTLVEKSKSPSGEEIIEETILENDVPFALFEETVDTESRCPNVITETIEVDMTGCREIETAVATKMHLTVLERDKMEVIKEDRMKVQVSGKRQRKPKVKFDMNIKVAIIPSRKRKVNIFRDKTDKKPKIQSVQKLNPGENNGYTCDVCQKNFRYRSHLIRHLTQHTGLKKYSCDLCEKSFTCHYNLKVHSQKHTGNYRHRCKICDKGYPSPSVLDRHMLSHTNEFKFSCKYCSKKLRTKSSLTIHVRMHVDRPTYSCDICSKTYSYTNSLSAHKKTHFKQEYYYCEHCDRRYTKKSSLRRHISSSCEQNYFSPYTKCNSCGADGFRSRSDYLEHIEGHNHLYDCKFCGKKYSGADFTLHLKNIHFIYNKKKHKKIKQNRTSEMYA